MSTPNSSLTWLALGLLIAFLAVAGIDGFYYHFKRFRLWAHAETRLEHGLHTLRAVAMPPTLAALFLPGRPWLLLAIALVAFDTVAAGLDVAVEWRSRRKFGGLPHGEYAVHLIATLLHVAGVTMAFVARTLPATEAAASDGSRWLFPIVGALVVVTAGAGVHHMVLLFRGSGGMLRAST